MWSPNQRKNVLFWFSFIVFALAFSLSAVSLTYDEITKVTFDPLVGNKWTEYCGWHKLHDPNQKITNEENHNDDEFAWAERCAHDEGNEYCDMAQTGDAWLGLLITGLIFGGVSILGYLFQICIRAHVLTLLGNIVFTTCMIAAMIEWSLTEICHSKCNTFTNFVVNCQAEWGLSWILCLVSGCLGILSIVTYKWRDI